MATHAKAVPAVGPRLSERYTGLPQLFRLPFLDLESVMKIMDKLRNLLVMAASDGKLSENEIRYLTDRCQQWGLTESALADAIEYALSDDAVLTLPPRESERMEMLEDLMSIMAADGNLAETELDLFAVAAARMEISDAKLNRLIDKLTQRK